MYLWTHIRPPLDELLAAVSAETGDGLEERIYVRGDTAAQYGAVMKVMGALAGAGYSHIGLITSNAPEE